MTDAMTFSEFLSKLPQIDATVVLGSASNSPVKMTQRSLASVAFGTVSNAEDLDNPTTRGIYNVNTNTIITKPTKGSGWNYGYVLNLAQATGIQVWFNFSGYIAIRSKGSTGAAWSDWEVMAKLGGGKALLCNTLRKSTERRAA